MNARSFHITAQGASHKKKHIVCQDASDSYCDEHCAIAIVCDGHGGADYVRSDIGSRFACEVAKENIISFLRKVDIETLTHNTEVVLRQLTACIISDWNVSIRSHFDSNPLTEAEKSVISEKARKKYAQPDKIDSAYGTTLIAAAMTRDFWFGLHIGDGKCVAVDQGSRFVQPIPWDEKCFLNETTSICDSHALENFRHFFSRKLPVAIFIGTDGIDGCFKDNEQFYNLYKTIICSFATTDFDQAYGELADYLPRLSAKGSGDDVSIAAVLDLDAISGLGIVREFKQENETAPEKYHEDDNSVLEIVESVLQDQLEVHGGINSDSDIQFCEVNENDYPAAVREAEPDL